MLLVPSFYSFEDVSEGKYKLEGTDYEQRKKITIYKRYIDKYVRRKFYSLQIKEVLGRKYAAYKSKTCFWYISKKER